MTLAVKDNQGHYPLSRCDLDNHDVKNLVSAATKHMYFQLFVKILLTMIELFLFFVVIISVKSDIQNEILKNKEQGSIERAKCKKDYEDNFCYQNDLPLAMKGFCESWKVCSETAPSEIGKTKAAARVIAQLINELVNPLSPKAITMFVMIIIAWMMLSKGIF